MALVYAVSSTDPACKRATPVFVTNLVPHGPACLTIETFSKSEVTELIRGLSTTISEVSQANTDLRTQLNSLVSGYGALQTALMEVKHENVKLNGRIAYMQNVLMRFCGDDEETDEDILEEENLEVVKKPKTDF